MTREQDGAGARRERCAGMRGAVAAGVIAAAVAAIVGAPGADAAALPHAGWGTLAAATAVSAPILKAGYVAPGGDIDTLPRLGTLCISDEAGNDVVAMGRMSDTTIFTRLLVTFADKAPITVRYDVSRDGTDYKTVLDRDYRTEASRADDYVISLAVDAMKVYPEVCSG